MNTTQNTTAVQVIPTANTVATVGSTATQQDILTEMVIQLKLSGSTTAHDVKKALRLQGFTTTQAEVSEVLKTTIDKDGITATFNGKYLTYTFVEDAVCEVVILALEVSNE